MYELNIIVLRNEYLRFLGVKLTSTLHVSNIDKNRLKMFRVYFLVFKFKKYISYPFYLMLHYNYSL